MKIAIIGTGYVGLVTGACLAEMGISVTCVDINEEKIENLKKGIIPIYEPGLEDLVHNNTEAGRLTFTTDLASAVNDMEIVFLAVGTPPGEDGSADLKYVLEAVRTVARNMDKYLLVVTKSTVPVGTSNKVKQAIREELLRRGEDIDFDVASNPEFLKEGDAINDFSKPNRIVVGVETERAQKLMENLYRPFTLNGHPVLFMDIPSAEMTKYAANAMLATRISFMNDIANLCELMGADVNMVRKGIATDERIGDKFLYSGAGYGGSCFPKDVKALVTTGREYGYEMRVIKAVDEVNERQKSVVFNKFSKYFDNEIKGKTVAVWGLSFKPQTDDMREAPSLVVIDSLLKAGCNVRVYDPVATDEAKKALGGKVYYAKDIYDAARGAYAILLITEWKQFRLPEWSRLAKLVKYPLVVDGRNIYDKEQLKAQGFTHIGIGVSSR